MNAPSYVHDHGSDMTRALKFNRQSGLSLIELMISIVLGLFLIGVALQVLLASKQSFRLEKEASGIQEAGRFSIEMLSREIALAGYTGCRSTAPVANVISGSGTAANWQYGPPGLEGFDHAQGVSAFPTQYRTDVLANTDSIIVRGGSGASLFGVISYASPTFQFNGSAGVNAVVTSGDLVLASNQACTQVSVMQSGVVTTSSLSHAAAGSPGNCSSLLGGSNVTCASGGFTGAVSLSAGSSLMPYSVSAFYLAPSAVNAAVPALWRARVLNTGGSLGVRKEELLQGVENLQFLYGYDTNADGLPNYFVAANNTTLVGAPWDWKKVVSVRVAMLLRSINAVESSNQANATFEGIAVPTDRFSRQRIYTTVQIKNGGSN